MIATLSKSIYKHVLYVAHEKKTYGEVDIYSVHSADTSADNEIIQKHYRRFCSSSLR